MLQAMTRARRASTRLAGWSVVVAFVLIGVALLLTVWTTRASVEEASEAVRGGQAMTLAHAVRADLQAFDELPTAADLAQILAAHDDDGLRYVGIFSGEQVLAEVGTATGGGLPQLSHQPLHAPVREPLPLRSARLSGGRMRVLVPVGLPGPPPLPRGAPGHPAVVHLRRFPMWQTVIEMEPLQANALREAARLSLGIGALAAASLLAVAIVLVRRESRRQADERDRERQRRLASLGEMSAVLAHEIRNPLASLKGNAQLLAQMLPAGEKPRAKAERVVAEAARLEKLTAELLDFVRTGKLRRAAADPAALVREAVAATESEGAAGEAAAKAANGEAAEKAANGEAANEQAGGAAITVEAGAAPASWSLDADRLREVIVNLVDNARAAGPPVAVAVSAVAGRLRIDVADRGPGVAGEDRERIFEPFVTGKTRGTGLGLAVARRVVEAHGGALEVLERPGGGALFRIEIPEGER